MKRIKLTQGKEAIVDDEDYEYLNQWKWHFHHGYAIRSSSHKKNPKRHEIKLHNEIIKIPKGYFIDHINCDPLDNRKQNLRTCSHQENCFNRTKQRTGKNKYKGVNWHIKVKKYIAKICVNYKQIHLGCFDNEIDAAKAYNEAAIKYHGKFARINIL